jgi:glycosyltransferase involved in cell wall biosynthesis
MRVAMIIHGYAPRIGGAERQLGALAPVLQAQGVDVSILTRRLPGTPAFEKIDGVPVYRLPVPGLKPIASLSFTLSALPVLKKLNPDILHAHELISPATTALTAHYLLNKPLILTPHLSGPTGDVQRMRHKILGGLRLALFRRETSAFVTISKEIDSELAAVGVPPYQRVCIANGVDAQRFNAISIPNKLEFRQKLKLPQQAFVAVYIGRLVPIKRLDILMIIWPEIRKTYPDAVLLIVGTGSLENELKQTAPPGVQFAGSQADITPYLQAADLFVLPSDSEGLPVSLLESMACELPCVVTRVGGIPDVIEHSENGWLVPPGDSTSLQQAIQTLFQDPVLRQHLGKMARQCILEKYTITKTAARLKDLYQAILQDGGRV